MLPSLHNLQLTHDPTGVKLSDDDHATRAPLILVACHPAPFDHPTRPHWQRALIRNATNEEFPTRGADAVFETVDVSKGGTHQADIFQFAPSASARNPWDRWLLRHKEAFDAVWLPDCGGMWQEMREYAYTNTWSEEVYAEWMEHILRVVLTLVRPGGILHLGRLPRNKDEFEARVLSMAVPNGLLDIERVELKHAGVDINNVLAVWDVGEDEIATTYLVVHKAAFTARMNLAKAAKRNA